MEALADLLTSPYIWAIVIAYLSAQTTKFALLALSDRRRKLTWQDYFASGGMPSSHAASIVAPTLLIGLKDGFGTALFALALVVAVIICYDACNIRRSVGEYGLVIDEMVSGASEPERDKWLAPLKADLKARGVKTGKNVALRPTYKRGHLLAEVIAGAGLGALVAILVYFLV